MSEPIWKTEEFQCRERLMGDCYQGTSRSRLLLQSGFQCRERLMGDCYWRDQFIQMISVLPRFSAANG